MSDTLGKTYLPGEAVVEQGEHGDCMFAILDGEAEVVRRRKKKALTVAILGKGDLFGEMALIGHRPRSATVRALTPLRVMTIDRKTFARRIQEDPAIAINLLGMLVDRIESLDEELTNTKAILEKKLKKERKKKKRKKNKRELI
jgi:CRP-like cAMP-binding protein